MKIILNIDWCPAHCNIEGNDIADRAAKIGAINGKKLNIKIGKTEVYSIIRQKVRKEWADNWKMYHGFRWDLDSSLPSKVVQYSDYRKLDRVYTRLRLGVNGLKANNMFYNEADPLCLHCRDIGKSEIEDENHYFFKCPQHKDHRDKMIRELQSNLGNQQQEITLKDILDPCIRQAEAVRKIVMEFIQNTEYDKII